MAQFLGPAFQQVLSASAVPYSGGKLYVYEPSTTTLISLFSDEAMQTPTANPMVADSTGSFTPVFLAETSVKLILKTSDDTTIRTIDPAFTTGVATDIQASNVSFDGTASGLSSDNVQAAVEEAVELQGLIQEWSTSSDGVVATGTSTNTGAVGGPDLDLYRDSASPAASDVIGGVRFSGENASDVKVVYAKIQTVITDATNGSEDGRLEIVTKTNGSDNTATKFEDGKVDAANGFYIGGIKHGIKSDTVKATTSGTTVDFTDIPAGVTRITLSLAGVSTSGSSLVLLQLGDSGGVESSGYVATGSLFISEGLGGSQTSTAGLPINSGTAVALRHGQAVFTLVDPSTNTWVMTFTGAASGANEGMLVAGGTKSLSGTLDRVRITTVNGTDTFDAGKANILYE